jgi:hypothetical protein
VASFTFMTSAVQVTPVAPAMSAEIMIARRAVRVDRGRRGVAGGRELPKFSV